MEIAEREQQLLILRLGLALCVLIFSDVVVESNKVGSKAFRRFGGHLEAAL